MELTVSDDKLKKVLKEIIVELIQDKKNVMSEIISDALEDVGLAQAIEQGRKNKFVDESEILEILESW